MVKWLGRQGLRPWEREDILKKAQDHGLDGSLLLSLPPSSILHVIGLDPIDDKGGNVEALSGGIANLRAQVMPTMAITRPVAHGWDSLPLPWFPRMLVYIFFLDWRLEIR